MILMYIYIAIAVFTAISYIIILRNDLILSELVFAAIFFGVVWFIFWPLVILDVIKTVRKGL